MERSWLTAIISSSNDAIVSKNLEGRVTSWNAAAERLFGYTAKEILGRSIRILVPDDLQGEEDRILSSIAQGIKVDSFETVRMTKSGEPIIVSVSISPILDDTGKVIGASKIARDVTEHVHQRERLRESELRFRTLADNMSQFAWMADDKGWIFWYNKRWFDYTGTNLEEMQGWGWQSVHHPDHVERVTQKIQHSWDTGEEWEDTFPLRSRTGEYRWFLSRAVPIRDDDGKIMRWFGTNTDITEQKEQEEQIRFLMGEVNHRAKNILALVQSIARQTAGKDRNSPFVKRFGERLSALAASQDLLVGAGWHGASVDELVQSQLGHFKDLIGNRILIEGERVRLTSAAAQMLGMALHELATNAGKYGALSNETGRVEIRWSTETDPGKAPRFRISWTETGGPSVQPPKRQGFGTSVVGKMCRIAFGGTVDIRFAPEGLSWSLESGAGRGIEQDPAVSEGTKPT